MIKHKNSSPVLLLATFLSVSFISCNSNSGSIPFPEQELGYSQPVTEPLHFSAEKKLTWDTARKGGVRPVIRKLDLEALPSIPYDSTGFKPFAKPPEEVSFDFNRLPDTTITLDSLPSKSLQFKTFVLAPPARVKTVSPSAQKGNPLSIFDFGPRHNLPALFVTSLLKDRNGMMWIGSQEGLFRYDGEHIQTYIAASSGLFVAGMAEDDQGRIWFIDQRRIGMIDPRKGVISYSGLITVPINNLSKIIKDKSGRIWISRTNGSDVIIIDPAAQTFKSLARSNGLSDLTGANDIAEDDNGYIWITTPFGGVSILNPATNKIKYLEKSTGLAKDSLRAITKDKAGTMWIATAGGGVEAIDLKRGKIKHYNESQGLRKTFTGDISSDDKGRIWIGKNQGVDVLDPENGRNRFIDDTRGLGAKWVASCTLDNKNRMWVATIGGLNIIDQNAETVNPIGATQAISLLEDTVGNLWVATQSGVAILDAKTKVLRRLNESNGLGNDFVQSFVKFNQQMWVTTNGGLDIIDPIQKTIEHIGQKEGLVNDTTYVVYQDKTGNIWLTGPSNGVNLVDAAKQTILHTDVAGGLSDNNIQDVKQDEEGQVWVAGNTGGVNVIDLKRGTVKYLNSQPGLKDTCSKMMVVDQYGRIWIGTDKGIYVADKKQGTMTAITTKQGLASNKVLSLQEYKGSVIAGTNNKVSIITAPPPAYAGMAIADTTNDPKANGWKIGILDRSEGLIRENVNAWSTDAVTSKGQFLWGDNGIAIINEIKPANDYASTYVTGMNVMNRPQYFLNKPSIKENDTLRTADTFYVKGQIPVNTGYIQASRVSWDSVSGAYNMPVNLSIPYNQNYIQFQFAQAHSGRQDITWYSYILEGIDKSWSIATTNLATENYLNLPPGTYSFKVRSQGPSGKWSEPAVFNFSISPPWYKTWWAYTLYALLGIGLIRAYIVYRSRQLQKENKLLEEKVSLRTRQLQQSLEDLKATQAQLIQSEKMASLGELTAGIAHEIQNPLNFINNFSEVNSELIAEMKEEIDKGNLAEVKTIANDIAANEQKINHHGKRADGIVKGMLQHSRTGNRQKEPTNINTLADEYLRLAYHGLRAKDKSFNAIMKTDFDESIGDINIISQDIGRVILNLITNAFYAVSEKKKHLANGYEPTVSVITKKINGKVEVVVKDNGNGIPQKVREKIFQPFFTTKPAGEGTGLGLSLSYDIIKAHNGELKVETREGEGSTFSIFLPQ